MHTFQVDDLVVLREDMPHMHLRGGTMGVIRGAQLSPRLAYEVEFHTDPHSTTRVLLAPDRLETAPRSPFDQGPEADGKQLYF